LSAAAAYGASSTMAPGQTYRWTDDGHIIPGRFEFDVGQNFVAWRQHGVHVVFDLGDGDSAHTPVGLCGLRGHGAPSA